MQVFLIGGSWSGGVARDPGVPDKVAEVFDGTEWTLLDGISGADIETGDSARTLPGGQPRVAVWLVWWQRCWLPLPAANVCLVVRCSTTLALAVRLAKGRQVCSIW